MKKVKILNVAFDCCTKDEALGRALKVLHSNESGRQIVTPNPEMLLEAAENLQLRDILNRAFLSIPDGIGILWAAAFQSAARKTNLFSRFIKACTSLACLPFSKNFRHKVFPERITGVDFMESLVATSRGAPIFLLGAQPGVAEAVQKFLGIKYRANVVGVFSGSPAEDDFPRIQALIAETRPELLFVAYGSPQQEFWISRHLHDLPSVKIAMAVGGAFDFLAGKKKRAPKWMQKLGMEWMYRLLQEPKRLKRICNATVRFPWMVWKQG